MNINVFVLGEILAFRQNYLLVLGHMETNGFSEDLPSITIFEFPLGSLPHTMFHQPTARILEKTLQ